MAVQCLSQAAKIYKREKLLGLSVLVTMEIAECLFKDGAFGEALKYYRSALDTVRSHFTYIDVILVTEQMIRCKLETTDYDSALKMINDTITGIGNCSNEQISPEFRALFINRLEISRVCLLMLLGTNTVDVLGFIWPDTKQVSSAHPQEFHEIGLKTLLPNKSTSSSSSSPSGEPSSGSSPSFESEKEFRRVQLQLKSLVIAVQHGSIDSVEEVRGHLAPIMQPCHHNLFEMLIKILSG